MPRRRRGWALQEGEEPFPRRHSPLIPSLLEPVLLIFLQDEKSHGYSLLNDLKAIGMDTIHPSVIYRTLRELESLEWISSEWNTNQTQGPPRRTYYLTPNGKEAVANWTEELKRLQRLITSVLEISSK